MGSRKASSAISSYSALFWRSLQVTVWLDGYSILEVTSVRYITFVTVVTLIRYNYRSLNISLKIFNFNLINWQVLTSYCQILTLNRPWIGWFLMGTTSLLCLSGFSNASQSSFHLLIILGRWLTRRTTNKIAWLLCTKRTYTYILFIYIYTHILNIFYIYYI